MNKTTIADFVGNTPLVKLKTDDKKSAEVWAKCEFLNPSGSIKDRVAKYAIEKALKAGDIKPGGTIIEATAGNTGLSLAMMATQYDLKCIFVVFDKASDEKIDMLQAYGAEVITTPTKVPTDSPNYYVNVAKRIHEETPNSFYMNQYYNPDNPKAYEEGLGPEIFEQMDGKLDYFVAGIGSGGTLSGAGKYLKEKLPDLKIIAADPIGSIYKQYFHTKEFGEIAPYIVEGVGQDILCSTMNFDIVDDVREFDDKDTFLASRELIKSDGLFVGGSSGAAAKIAKEIALEVGPGKRIVTILADSADRYLNKFISDDWLAEHGFLEREENEYGFATTAIHPVKDPDSAYNSTVVPIYQNSTYSQPSPGKFIGSFDYARTANPTRSALETGLAKLERADYCSVFSSGCAAIDAILHTLNSGDHVILSDDVYGGTFRIFDQIFQQLGIGYSIVDLSSKKAVQDATTENTKMLWLETPSNPLLKVIDLAEVQKWVPDHVITVVDNTFATPYLQNPLELGIDIVCHSNTKYIGGHADVIGGSVMLNDQKLAERIAYIQNAIGAVPGPFDCYLLLRSIKTLNLRVKAQSDSAFKIAEYLESHSNVEKVHYPGLKSHPQHDVAKKQMREFGAMIAFELKGGNQAAKKFFDQSKLFTLAESLGGVSSLAEIPAVMTHASIPKEQREAIGITDGLIRLSIGAEDLDDLLKDVENSIC